MINPFILKIFIWLFKSIIIYFVFIFSVPPLVHTWTLNHWIKLPILLIIAIVAGIFMAWLSYVPGLLFLIWLYMVYHSVKFMGEQEFTEQIGLRINKRLFFISEYSYAILACFTAYFLQSVIVSPNDPTGEGIPVWKYILTHLKR